MINFAELKEKLCHFKKIEGMTINWQNGALWQFEKDAKIISELLDVIENQNNDIESALYICDMAKYGAPKSRKKFLNTLSETESKLKQLIKGE